MCLPGRRQNRDRVADRTRQPPIVWRPRGLRLAMLGILGLAMTTLALMAIRFHRSQDPVMTDSPVGDAKKLASGTKSVESDRALLDRPSSHAATIYNSGLELHLQGKLSEAISRYREALNVSDDNPKLHNNLAVALASQGKLEEALQHFRRVTELEPDYAEGHFNLGNALMAAKQVEEAIQHYERAVALKSDYAKAHNNLAVALKQSGRLREAYQHIHEAMRLNREAEP